MKTKTTVVTIGILVFMTSCGKTVNDPFTGLFGGEIRASSGASVAPAPVSGIAVLSTQTVTGADLVGNIIYDGVRLLLPDTTGAGFPISNNVGFDYLSTSLVFQTASATNYANASIFYGFNSGYNSPAPNAGQSALFWTTSYNASSGTLSVRDNSNGTILSTTAINFANYGCANSGPIVYCGGAYYGACSTFGGCVSNAGCMRFFSFNTSGTMQSAVTTAKSKLDYGNINAITCYNGSSLLLVTNYSDSNAYNGFYKYDLSFNLVATDPNNSYSFPSAVQSIKGISTDGSYLYLQANGSSTYTVGKATLGGLK
jgi:hypothetical protein